MLIINFLQHTFLQGYRLIEPILSDNYDYLKFIYVNFLYCYNEKNSLGIIHFYCLVH